MPIRLTPDCYCKNMDYLTTYWDKCCNYEGGYAETQYNYMPSLICKSILKKNCSILFEPPSYYCTMCASKIFTLSLIFWYMRPRQKWENKIKMGQKKNMAQRCELN